MSPEIRLTVTQNDKLIQTVTRTIENQQLVQSIEKFQVEVNAALTKMIEGLGEIDEVIGDTNMDEVDDDETEDENDEGSQSAGVESKGYSESKKKKHH